MKFEIVRASDSVRRFRPAPCETAFQEGENWFVEIATLEDLMALNKAVGNDLIVSGDSLGGPHIWIYDSYME